MTKLTVKIENFKALRSNTLFGFCDVRIPELRVRIHDVTVHESHRKRWIGLPAKPMIGRDGMPYRNERGKITYTQILEFTDKGTGNAFSHRVIEALLESFPNAFGGEAAA